MSSNEVSTEGDGSTGTRDMLVCSWATRRGGLAAELPVRHRAPVELGSSKKASLGRPIEERKGVAVEREVTRDSQGTAREPRASGRRLAACRGPA